MKTLKKFVCLLLTLCVTLTAFSAVSPSLAMANEPSAYYGSDLAFLESLGITDGVDTSDSTRTVSRAEFVAMAVKIINPNLDIKFTGDFTDVTSDTIYSNEIYTALTYGLLNGTTEGTFSPESPITYAAALKILVAALGYEEYAYITGGYPTGYIMQAGKVGITDGVSAFGANDSISFESAVSLIANALKCDLRKIVTVTDDYVETKVAYGTNCLTEYFGFEKVSGILTTAGSYSMNDGYFAEESMVQIGDLSLYCGLSGIEEYLGYNVDCWYDKSKNELRAFSVSDGNETVSFDSQNVVSYSDFEIKVEDESGKTKSYGLDKGFSFVLNGRLIAPEDSDFIFSEGEITLVDNSGDKGYDVVVAKKKEHFVIKSINLSEFVVYDKKNSGKKLVLKNEDGYFYSLEKAGVSIEPSALSEEDVLEVYQSRDGYVSKVKVSDVYVKGTITGIGNDVIYVDEKPFEYNEYFKNNFNPELSTSGTFLLDSDGKITYISSLYRDRVEYGFFLDFGGKTSSLSSERKMKVLTENGTVEIFELSDKVKLDGELYSKEAPEIQNALMNGEYPRYQLIRFGKNNNGKVNLIDLSSDISEKEISPSLSETDALIEKYGEIYSAEDSLTRYVKASDTHAYWRSSGSAFLPFFTIGNTTMISVPSAMKPAKGSEPEYSSRYVDDAFRVVSTADLGSYEEKIYIDAYDYDDAMSPKFVVIYNGNAQAGAANIVTPLNSAVVHVVESVTDVVNEEGEQTKRIYAYANKKFVTYDIDPNLCSMFEVQGLIPSSGDVVRFSFGSKYINGIAIDAVFDETTSALAVNYKGAVSTNPAATLTYASGSVFSFADASSLVIKTDNYPTGSSYPTPIDGLCSVKTTGSTQVVLYDTKTKSISHGRTTDLKDIRSAGEDEASYVCVRLNGYEPRLIVIYR